MRAISVYPVILSNAVAETAAFYREHFGFRVVFECDWYVSLAHTHAAQQELAVMLSTHESIPGQDRTPSSGMLINFEVEDAQAEFERLVGGAGLQPVQSIRDEATGQRHFILRDPSGNLVDVIENIEPSAEFAENFVS